MSKKTISVEELNAIKELRKKIIKFEEIYYQNIPYYIDKYNNICDSNTKLVGIVNPNREINLNKQVGVNDLIFFTIMPKKLD